MDRRQGGRLGNRSHGHGHPQEQSSQNQATVSITASTKAVTTPTVAADFRPYSRANISEVSVRFCWASSDACTLEISEMSGASTLAQFCVDGGELESPSCQGYTHGAWRLPQKEIGTL